MLHVYFRMLFSLTLSNKVTSDVFLTNPGIVILIPEVMFPQLTPRVARLLPAPAPSVLAGQQLRFKKFGRNIVPHRKPRWVPMARSKMFKNPPESTISKDERKHIHELNEEYMKRIKALQFYVYEDDLKAGDTGEAAVIAAEREEESHLVNLKVKLIEYGVVLYLSCISEK